MSAISVRLATTANGDLSEAFVNGEEIDGVELKTGDLILLENQTNAAQNGVYSVNAEGAPTRSALADSPSEIASTLFKIEEGVENAGTVWACETAGTIGIGSSSLSFAQISAPAPDSEAAVTSVAGRTGDVTLAHTDISGLGTAATQNTGAFDAAGSAAAAQAASQPLDAELTAIAGLTSAANKGIQFTGSGAAATYDLTTAGKALLDDADAAAQRATLGLRTLTTDSDGATVTFDVAASTLHTVVLGGNRTLALSNVQAGDKFVIRLTQDGTGSRTVTWFTTIKWAGGVAPTLTTTLNKADCFGFICTSSGNYDGFVIGQNI